MRWFFDGWFVPVTRLRQTAPRLDPLGVPIKGSGTTESVALPEALRAPGRTVEDPTDVAAPGDLNVYSDAVLYWPDAQPDVLPSDRFLVDGAQWSVVGNPKRYPRGTAVAVNREEQEWSV